MMNDMPVCFPCVHRNEKCHRREMYIRVASFSINHSGAFSELQIKGGIEDNF